MPSMKKCLRLTVSYGYDIHSILLLENDVERIVRGEAVTLDGHGFCGEEGLEQDTWMFNCPNRSKVMVVCDSGRDLFEGDEFTLERESEKS